MVDFDNRRLIKLNAHMLGVSLSKKQLEEHGLVHGDRIDIIIKKHEEENDIL